jgi:trimethylamine--corrinoid protein Co-methyltransferase
MERYAGAFYEPLVADWSNYGTWAERGGQDASTRATALWEKITVTSKPPASATPERLAALDAFAAVRAAEGGAEPVS